MKKNILGLSEIELETLAVKFGEQPFRGRQLYRQIYHRGQTVLTQMSDLSCSFRSALDEEWTVAVPEIYRETVSRDGTVKFLHRLQDNRFVESVFIPEEQRCTLCISSQVGCNVGCTFCMTAQMPLERNLKPDEMVGQVLAAIQRGLLPRRGFNIVFMGMGEPLYNYRNVRKAFRLLTDGRGIGLAPRRITISTSGVVPVLKRMRTEKVLPNLAISLNAVSNSLRDRLMPINKRWSIEKLLQVCRDFPREPQRRITFEYVLLKGINDSLDEADALARLLAGIQGKVNLIPFNPAAQLIYKRPASDRVERFRRALVMKGVPCYIRRPRGDDIAAACGQLAHARKEQ